MKKIITIAYKIIDLFPKRFAERIKIILNVLLHDWSFFPVMVSHWDYIETILALRESSIEDRFYGMDKDSIAILKRFIEIQTLYCIPQHNIKYCIYSRNGLWTKEEYRASKKLYRQEMRAKRRYGFKRTSDYLSSLVYHHGLAEFTDAQKSSLAETAFIDAGAFIGDSSLAMLEYGPSKIYAFDPSEKNCEAYRKTMKRKRIAEDCYTLVAAGLGAENKTILNFNDSGSADTRIEDSHGTSSVKIVTLDSFWQDNMGKIGFIKADVEGAGLDLIIGAEQCIRKYLPVLSIAIYHNEKEFFGIYKLLNSWNLPYRFKIRKYSYCWENTEITLLAIPDQQ